MPLPIAHSFAGYIVHESKPFVFFKKGWHDMLFLMFLANSADLDFLPGYLIGHPNQFHHEYSHTLFAGGMVALIVGTLFRKRDGFLKPFLISFIAYATHLCLDYFTEDLRPPFGIPLFWPFSDKHYIFDHPVFMRVIRSDLSGNFFPSLFNQHNITAMLKELLVMGGIWFLVWLLKKKSKHSL